jgi:CMP-N-acetylneuraminic acid synthetase
MKVLNKVEVDNCIENMNNNTIFLSNNKFIFNKSNYMECNTLKVYDIDNPNYFETIEIQSNLYNNYLFIELETKDIKLLSISFI